MTQEEFDRRLDDPIWGIASPIPTLLWLATIGLLVLIAWVSK